MKKIFLINFSTPILIEVARQLKDKGIEILYWQGYRDAFDALAKSKQGFENTLFRHAFDTIKNVPPKGIDVSDFEPIDAESIERMYSYGWHGLSMLSRADTGKSTFVQKRHMYYAYIKFWYGLIKKLKPDTIVFVATPPSAVLFVLYGIARVLGIRVVSLERLIIDSRTLIVTDFEKGSEALRDTYAQIKDTKHTIDDVSEDLRAYYIKNTTHTDSQNTRFSHLSTHNNNMPFRVPSIQKILKHFVTFTFVKTTVSYISMLVSKRKTHYFNADLTGLQWMFLKRKWGSKARMFKKEYTQYQKNPNYEKNYVYVPLAFQPEQTTCPMGGVYDDQLLMIDMLSHNLPEGWVLYVKEHLPQWYPHSSESHLYRYEGYYAEIANMKNVQLIPAETSPKKMIAHAQAVATVTGTAGWEALLKNIPVLVFGSIWYMYCEGVFRVTSNENCKEAFSSIQNGYIPDSQRVINYLVALDKVSIKSKNYKTRAYIQNDDVSEHENISNLTESIYAAITR